jgi:hypothetical protein
MAGQAAQLETVISLGNRCKIKFMRQGTIILLLVTLTAKVIGQDTTDRYAYYSKKADSLFTMKAYKDAAISYSKAFESLGWKGSLDHRYGAARAWALSGSADSAFFQLENIVTKQKYTNYERLIADSALAGLRADKRWHGLIDMVKQNKELEEKAASLLNKPLIAQLDSIFEEDQKPRIAIDTIVKKYGWESPEMIAQGSLIRRIDSINLVKIKSILDNYGWLGSDVIGSRGNVTLFLVIQHADQATQEKYLPMMREAVKNGKAQPGNLALLEDRVALGQGKKQIYGSQIGMDKETNRYFVLPLDDPDNVDKRRATAGLEPLAYYIKRWKIDWDVEQYKKDLPALEAKMKVRK